MESSDRDRIDHFVRRILEPPPGIGSRIVGRALSPGGRRPARALLAGGLAAALLLAAVLLLWRPSAPTGADGGTLLLWNEGGLVALRTPTGVIISNRERPAPPADGNFLLLITHPDRPGGPS